MHGGTYSEQLTPRDRPRTALHGLRIGLPAGAAGWALLVGLVRRLRRR